MREAKTQLSYSVAAFHFYKLQFLVVHWSDPSDHGVPDLARKLYRPHGLNIQQTNLQEPSAVIADVC